MSYVVPCKFQCTIVVKEGARYGIRVALICNSRNPDCPCQNRSHECLLTLFIDHTSYLAYGHMLDTEDQELKTDKHVTIMEDGQVLLITAVKDNTEGSTETKFRPLRFARVFKIGVEGATDERERKCDCWSISPICV